MKARGWSAMREASEGLELAQAAWERGKRLHFDGKKQQAQKKFEEAFQYLVGVTCTLRDVTGD